MAFSHSPFPICWNYCSSASIKELKNQCKAQCLWKVRSEKEFRLIIFKMGTIFHKIRKNQLNVHKTSVLYQYRAGDNSAREEEMGLGHQPCTAVCLSVRSFCCPWLTGEGYCFGKVEKFQLVVMSLADLWVACILQQFIKLQSEWEGFLLPSAFLLSVLMKYVSSGIEFCTLLNPLLVFGFIKLPHIAQN